MNEFAEGVIRKVRNHGGIIFFTLLSDNRIIKLKAEKKSNSGHFSDYSKIKKGDYCRFKLGAGEAGITYLKLHLPGSKEKNPGSPELIDRMRVYSFILQKCRTFFDERGFVEVRPPSLHSGIQKGNIFALDFFKQRARLTSSNALYLNIYAAQMQKVFSLQRCFRAEKSHTKKHLSEFDMLETAFMNNSLEESMALCEKLIRYLCNALSQSEFSGIISHEALKAVNKSFKIRTYHDTAQEFGIKDNKGLGRYEAIIAKDSPVFITYFPKKIASWMARPKDHFSSASFNLLLPGVGETAEGNEKQTCREALLQKFKIAGMEEQLRWYLDMMPYSGFFLSGFGIGIDRLVMWFLDASNIRDLNLFYRDTGFSERKGKRK